MLYTLYSRSTAIDLLSSGRVRDSRRQHIQHQLDSLRFYDSVPLYDGLRRFTPATTTTTAVAQDPSTGHRCNKKYLDCDQSNVYFSPDIFSSIPLNIKNTN